ncbi:MAG: hypothetical protein HY455_01795 [Parcubacteria group bacterium]|nr:hypothetical protein [Parcubacteria group bacterium]
MDFLKKMFGMGKKDDGQMPKEPQVNPDMNRVDTSMGGAESAKASGQHEHKSEDKNVCEFC